MIPEMNRKGYNREFNVAVTTTAATTGLLIPPSNIMIVYSVAAGSVSIAAMFMAGVLPGIITGPVHHAGGRHHLGLRRLSRRSDRNATLETDCRYADRDPRVIALEGLDSIDFNSVGHRRRHLFGLISVVCCICFTTFRRAYLTLLLIVIVIGGILGGIFTATEAAAIAVVYAFLLSVVIYREIKLKELPQISAADRHHHGGGDAADRRQLRHELDHDHGQHSADRQRRAARPVRQPDRHPADHQPAAAVCRHVHGHDPGGADLHADLPAGGRRRWACTRCISASC